MNSQTTQHASPLPAQDHGNAADAQTCEGDATPPAAASDRDAQGRFGKGNKGGPGNPFARQVAAYRRAIHEEITEEGMRSLAKMLFAKALEGDIAAARLVLQYSIGKPAETVNPDTLDIEEWKHWQANATRGDVFSQIMNMLPADVAVQVLRGLIPVIGRDMASFMAEAGRYAQGIRGAPAVPAPAQKHDPRRLGRHVVAGGVGEPGAATAPRPGAAAASAGARAGAPAGPAATRRADGKRPHRRRGTAGGPEDADGKRR